MEHVARILSACGTDKAVLPATHLYNENVMLWLLLGWFERQGGGDHDLDLLPGARWFSEGRLASRFLKTKHREGYTHADGVVGHFRVVQRGEVQLLRPPTGQFVVVEGKLGSPLDTRVRHAEGYDQAARNVACIAHLVGEAGYLESLDRFGFWVLAPAAQIHAGVFGSLVTKNSILTKVEKRCEQTGERAWFEAVFVPCWERLPVRLESWEKVLSTVASRDPDFGGKLQQFYNRCIEHNLRRPVSGGENV